MLTDKQAAQYFHRCYTAVDGLWFVKVEEKHGLEAALEADDQVWRVLPKIQARMLKAMLNADQGMDALRECLTTKLTLDQFEFETQNNSDGFSVLVKRCPWHDQMVKSGREHLSGTRRPPDLPNGVRGLGRRVRQHSFRASGADL